MEGHGVHPLLPFSPSDLKQRRWSTLGSKVDELDSVRMFWNFYLQFIKRRWDIYINGTTTCLFGYIQDMLKREGVCPFLGICISHNTSQCKCCLISSVIQPVYVIYAILYSSNLDQIVSSFLRMFRNAHCVIHCCHTTSFSDSAQTFSIQHSEVL